MEQKEYIAALDLGTSKISAMAASKNRNGDLTVFAAVEVNSETCVRRGFVSNTEEAGKKISTLLYKLDGKLRPGLEKIYVGIGGPLRTEVYTIREEINGIPVDKAKIDSIEEKCKQYKPELAEVLDIVSPEYYLDGVLVQKPIGVSGRVIEAKFLLILGRPSLKLCLQKSIEEKTRYKIAGYFISPLATAEVTLSEKEKELGCALVEFGAGVTYLSIYKGKLLRYMIAIPLGGNVITKDLCSIDMLETDAENFKITQGSAISEVEQEQQTDIIIEARTNEIIANVEEQIRVSGYAGTLPEGIIITGGASQLKNLPKALHEKMKMQVKEAVLPTSITMDKNVEKTEIENPANSTILGLLTLGTENCAKEVSVTRPEPTTTYQSTRHSSSQPKDPGLGLFGEDIETIEKQPNPIVKKEPKKEKTPKKSIFDIFGEKLGKAAGNLFDDDNDNTNK